MEQKLKERLIGTAVITALAVIFLPMLIDEEDQRWIDQKPVANVPPLPEKYKNSPKILSEAGIDDRHLFPISKKPENNPENKSKTSINTKHRDKKTGSETAAVPVIKQPVLKTPASKQKSPDMQQQLKSLLPATRKIDKKQSTGQDRDHQKSASKQKAKPQNVKKSAVKTIPVTVKKSPQVVARIQPPVTPIPSSAQGLTKKPEITNNQSKKTVNSDLTGLWIVQAGVFKEKPNAEALRKKLSNNGFAAYLESVTTELGELIRVRAGRVPEENAARQMVLTLNKRFGLSSITFPETKWNSKRAGQ